MAELLAGSALLIIILCVALFWNRSGLAEPENRLHLSEWSGIVYEIWHSH